MQKDTFDFILTLLGAALSISLMLNIELYWIQDAVGI